MTFSFQNDNQYSSRISNLLYYNELGIIIMIEQINLFIKNFIKFNIDMLILVSAASCVAQVKYLFHYSQFQLDYSYQTPNINHPF
jgi:hypothetical protein